MMHGWCPLRFETWERGSIQRSHIHGRYWVCMYGTHEKLYAQEHVARMKQEVRTSACKRKYHPSSWTDLIRLGSSCFWAICSASGISKPHDCCTDQGRAGKIRDLCCSRISLASKISWYFTYKLVILRILKKEKNNGRIEKHTYLAALCYSNNIILLVLFEQP